MFRKLITMCALGALAIGVVPIAGASAAPPEQIEVPDYINLFLDVDEGKSAWVNITAFDFCMWAFNGFVGPAPVIDAAVPASVNETGQDGQALVASIKAPALYIEVWNLDNPDGPYLGACDDILQQLLAGGSPWATGTTSVNTRTNNLFEADTRAVSGVFSGTANLTTTDGAESYRYHFNDHFGNRCSEFRCAVTNTSLRQK